MALSNEVVIAIFSGIGALIGGVTTLVGQRIQAAKDQNEAAREQRTIDVALFDRNMQWAGDLMGNYKERLETLEGEVKELRKTLTTEFEKTRDCEDRYTTLEGQLNLVNQELGNMRRLASNSGNGSGI